ncbi:hypothetical protein JTE90_016589 [Oedothorax gibbosus]|uniref:Uncharacterized protein n=1 Tax=Oedothorax gibbosus TaxID=931172 RepID=A0AAV6TPS8_9ARAC|nr:hypothetical protein JTE90_016589 [Oedothorax gibbosus]
MGRSKQQSWFEMYPPVPAGEITTSVVVPVFELLKGNNGVISDGLPLAPGLPTSTALRRRRHPHQGTHHAQYTTPRGETRQRLGRHENSISNFVKDSIHSEEDDTTSLPCVSSDVDQYLDEVLVRARAELPDPLRLPPRSSVVELSDGLLRGLSNITRLGEAEVSCEGDDIRIKAVITSDEIKARFPLGEEKPGSDWEGYAVFISNDFQAQVEGVMEKREGGQKFHPRLERFRINKFKDARVEMTGLRFISYALGEMTTLMSGIFQRSIASAIQGPLKEALARHMRELEIQ